MLFPKRLQMRSSVSRLYTCKRSQEGQMIEREEQMHPCICKYTKLSIKILTTEQCIAAQDI